MNWARKLVAGKKRHETFEGNFIDMKYISQRIIAAGFPAVGIA
jgi:hypothetical protein